MSGRTALVALAAALLAGPAVAATTEAPGPAAAIKVIALTLDADAGTAAFARGAKTLAAKAPAEGRLSLDLAPLGLPVAKGERYVGSYYPGRTFIPPFAGPLKLLLADGRSHTISLRRLEPRPVLVGTSHHVSEQADDIVRLTWDAKQTALSGVSRILADDAYELRIVCPPEPKAWRLAAVGLSAADLEAGVAAHPWQSGPWAGATLKSPVSRNVAWTVHFLQEFGPGKTSANVTRLRGAAASHKAIELRWDSEGGAYRIARNDGRAFASDAERLVDTDVKGETTYTYTVSATGWDGASKPVTVSVTTPKAPPPPPTPDVFISDLKPVKATVGWNDHPRVNKSIEDNAICMAGRVYEKGIGVHALSELVYSLKPDYAAFLAVIGADDEKGPGEGSVVFEIFADDKRLFRSKTKRAGDEPDQIKVQIPKGAKQFRLLVGDAGDGIGCDHADWAWAGFVLSKKEK